MQKIEIQENMPNREMPLIIKIYINVVGNFLFPAIDEYNSFAVGREYNFEKNN